MRDGCTGIPNLSQSGCILYFFTFWPINSVTKHQTYGKPYFYKLKMAAICAREKKWQQLNSRFVGYKVSKKHNKMDCIYVAIKFSKYTKPYTMGESGWSDWGFYLQSLPVLLRTPISLHHKFWLKIDIKGQFVFGLCTVRHFAIKKKSCNICLRIWSICGSFSSSNIYLKM